MESDRPSPRRKATFAERRERRAAVESVDDVLEAAARYLEARPRSVAEVRRRLTTAGYRPVLIEAAVERLIELQYLDDDAFARAWIESRDRARPRGEHALRRELDLKGVERSIVDTILDDRREAALAGAAGDQGEGQESPDEAAAERLLEKKLPALLREPDARRRRQRAYALLARSGFSPDVCAVISRRFTEQVAGLPEESDGHGDG